MYRLSWKEQRNTTTVSTLGPNPSDTGSSPGGGMFRIILNASMPATRRHRHRTTIRNACRLGRRRRRHGCRVVVRRLVCIHGLPNWLAVSAPSSASACCALVVAPCGAPAHSFGAAPGLESRPLGSWGVLSAYTGRASQLVMCDVVLRSSWVVRFGRLRVRRLRPAQ